MSGAASSVASPTTSSGGDVAIWVAGQKIAGWMGVQITRSIELFPNHFKLTLAEVTGPQDILVTPGVACDIYIGTNLVISGYIDRYSTRVAPNTHLVEISGRGLCEDLVDCSAAPVGGGMLMGPNAVALAQQLVAPWSINVICRATDVGPPIPQFAVALGDTPYELIERVSRYAGYLVFEDEFGNLILDRVGTNKMASGFAEGVNVESAAVSFTTDQRFTEILMAWSTVDQVNEGANTDVFRRHGDVRDATFAGLGRYRPKIIVNALTDNRPEYAQRMVNWEMNRRWGRSRAVHLTCDNWRDSAGRLWQPNWLAQIALPSCKLNQTWIIATVVFRKDETGTHADLVLMEPAAFAIEPNPLMPTDPELIYSIKNPNAATPAAGGET